MEPTDCISPRCLHCCELSRRLRSRCEKLKLVVGVFSFFFAEQPHCFVAGSIVSPFHLYRLIVPFFFIVAGHAVGVETVGVQGGSIG